MNKQNIKEFWNEHKKGIIIGTVAGLGGIGLGLVIGKPSKLERDLLRDLKLFGKDDKGVSLLQNLDFAQTGSTHAKYVLPALGNKTPTLASAAGALLDVCQEEGISLDSTVTGMVVFLKPEN